MDNNELSERIVVLSYQKRAEFYTLASARSHHLMKKDQIMKEDWKVSQISKCAAKSIIREICRVMLSDKISFQLLTILRMEFGHIWSLASVVEMAASDLALFMSELRLSKQLVLFSIEL